MYPNDGVAIVVLTNEVASGAGAEIAAQLTALLLPVAVTQEAAPDAVATALPGILADFAKGKIDRSLFTANCNAYFSAEAVQDFTATLAPLGPVRSVYRTKTESRGGMQFAAYRVVFGDGTTLILDTYTQPDGKFEQMLVTSRE